MGEVKKFLRRKVLAKPIVLPAKAAKGGQKIGPPMQRPDMNVLAVSHEATLTGAPKIILGLVRELVQNTTVRCSSIINNHGITREDFRAHSDVYYLDVKRAETKYLKRMVQATIRQACDDDVPTIGLVNSVESRFVGQALSQLGVPVVSLVHELPSSYTAADFELIARTSNHVVFPAEYVREAATNFVSFDHCPHSVIPQGLLNSSFGTNWKTEGARRFMTAEIGIPRNANIVLGCGTADLRKGIDHFVNAARAFFRRYPGSSDTHFVWVGDVVEELHSPFHFLKLDMAKSGIAERIHFIGQRHDVEPYFQAADAMLMVSREDPFPCVVHEAMACGLPIITFANNGGAPEALQGGAGLVVPYGDSESIAYELQRLQTSPDFRRLVESKAVDRVTNVYDFQAYSRRIETLLRETLGISTETTQPLTQPLRIRRAA